MASLEPLDIIVKIQQKQELDHLVKAAEVAAGKIAELNLQLKQGAVNQQQFNMLAGGYAASIATITPRIKELETAHAGLGRGLGQLAYAIDDVQYGFNAIVNNIPQIVMGLGGTAGVAGAVGIAAVAINQLIKHWDDLTHAFQAWNSGDTVAQIERIKKATDDAAESFKKLAEHGSTEQVKGAAAAKAGIEKLGPEQLAQLVTQAILGDPKQRPTLEPHEMPIGKKEHPWSKEAMINPAAIDKAIATKARRQADILIGQAALPEGVSARAALARMVPELSEIDPMTMRGQAPGEQQGKDIRSAKDVTDSVRKADEHLAKEAAMKWIEARRHGAQEAEHNRKQRAHDEDAEEKKVWERARDKRLQALQDQQDMIREREHKLRFDASMNKHGSAGGHGLEGVFADLRQGAFESGEATVGKQQLRKLEAIHEEIKKNNELQKKEKRAVFQ